MGSRSGCCALFVAAVVAIFIPPVLGVDHVVGDDAGWTTNFDYHAWAQQKVFLLGDTLLFKYKQGEHNVFKVNGTSFQRCVPPADVQPLTTGEDVIVLKTPGKKWYICGVGLHCDAGQKLVITVLDQLGEGASPVSAPPPSPLPTNSTNSLPPSPLPTPSVPLPANSTNSPPPSAATRAVVSGHVVFLMMAFSVQAGIMIMA